MLWTPDRQVIVPGRWPGIIVPGRTRLPRLPRFPRLPRVPWPSQAPWQSAPLFVQQKGNSSNLAATLDTTFDAAVTSGNIVVAFANIHSGGNQTITVSGLTGATWASLRDSAVGATGHKAIWIGSGFTGGTVVTLTPSSGTPRMGLTVVEFSGVTTTGDQANSAGNFNAAPATGGITTTNAADLIVAMMGEGPTPVISGDPPTGWTGLAQIHAAGFVNLASCYRIETGTGTFSAAWTTDISDDWEALIVGLQASGAAAAIALAQQSHSMHPGKSPGRS